jgi:hypothetical protein
MEQGKSTGLMLNPKSSLSTVAINDPTKHGAIISDLRRSVKEAVQSPSFNQLAHSGANLEQIENLLAVLLVKYSNMLSVGGNLKPGQSVEIAKNIIEDWPTMSLDDFNILLSNGVKGRYNEPGKLFRFDIAVIYEWIGAYQDEYCEVIENLPKQPTALEMLPDEKLIEIQEAIAKSEGVKPVRPMTEAEIKAEGQEKPPKKEYRSPDKSYLEMIQLKAEYGRTCCDLHTGQTLPGKPSFSDWIAQNI